MGVKWGALQLQAVIKAVFCHKSHKNLYQYCKSRVHLNINIITLVSNYTGINITRSLPLALLHILHTLAIQTATNS